MRVTICCKRFGPSGGAETFVSNFVRCLLAGGHRVRIITAEPTGPVEGVEVAELAVPPVPKTFRDLALARAARRALEAEDADVTFSDQKCWGARVVRPGGGVQREYVKQRIKAFRSPAQRIAKRLAYALSIRERLRIHIDDTLYRPPGPELIIANSDMVRRHLKLHYPHLTGRIRVVYNGADVERFHPGLKEQHRASVREELDIPQEALVGVFVGTGWRRKGLHTFVEALGLLARRQAARPFYGIVVGRGPVRAMRAFAARRGAGDLVRFAGQDQPDRYYGAADFLALPTYFDPCANVTLEALACGLPIITSVHNGAHELLTPGTEGFSLEDPSDACGLAGFMEQMADEGWHADASEAARALAMEHTLERQHAELTDAILPLAG